ncbi:MAG: hypothetical protein QXT10_04525 [Candidatus Bathyarchaeia archaeon]
MGLSLKGILKSVGKIASGAIGAAVGGVVGGLATEALSKVLGKKKKKKSSSTATSTATAQAVDRITELQRWLAMSEVAEQMGRLKSLAEWQTDVGKKLVQSLPSYLDQMRTLQTMYLGYMLPYYSQMLNLPTPQSLWFQLPAIGGTEPTSQEMLHQLFGNV